MNSPESNLNSAERLSGLRTRVALKGVEFWKVLEGAAHILGVKNAHTFWAELGNLSPKMCGSWPSDLKKMIYFSIYLYIYFPLFAPSGMPSI